ncbi:MAG: hypothetical protein HW383_854 [Candidatus Magasanikbacteria bacterium]|nr:hypothetical protein [Candidatus Magasanikbacteria bacterium]
MYITWLGRSAVRIDLKAQSEDVVVLFDPYRPEKENFPRSFSPDLVLLTAGEKNLVTLSKEPFTILEPGEYERKTVLVYGMATDGEEKKPSNAPTVIYRAEIEGVSLAFLGNLHRPLSEEELNALSSVDALFVPVGGGNVLDGAKAADLATRIEPRLVFPIDFKAAETGAEFSGPEAFLKAIGKSGIAPVEKFKLTKKELPTEEMQVVLLEKYERE